MNAHKWRTLALYTVMAVCMVAMPGTQVAQIIGWIFIGLAVAHILEFIFVFRLLSAAPGSLLTHFIHTFLFGFMHWLPIRRQQSNS